MNNNRISGSLHIILGPMFAGKTTRLVELFNSSTVRTAVINFSLDTRYDPLLLSTHDKVMIPCIQSADLLSLLENPEIMAAEMILINEAQLFPDIYDCVLKWVEINNKNVYIFGLDGDFRRELFGDIYRLLPLCDSIEKLVAKCNICNQNAIFTKRLTAEKEQIVIGADNYVPLCRGCFIL